MNAYVGMPVIYVPRPGRRETEIAALVTAFYPDDRCDLVLFPPMAESYQQPKVPMISDKFTSHVWKVPVKEQAAESTSLNPDGPSAAHIQTDAWVAQLEARVTALETKRGPGRPPNPAKAEQAA